MKRNTAGHNPLRAPLMVNRAGASPDFVGGAHPQLHYAELMSSYSGSASYVTILSSNPIWCDGKTTLLLEFYSPEWLDTTDAYIYFFDGATTLDSVGRSYAVGAMPMLFTHRFIPTIGWHTFHVKGVQGGLGMAGLAPNFFRISVAK